MYPPKVADQEIRSVIRALTHAGKLPSGVAVRDALASRYGSPGGVARIYRLLDAETALLRGTPGTAVPMSGPMAAVGIGLLEQEIRNLREQLRHVREREDAHQAHWSREVNQLRQRVQALEPLVKNATAGPAGDALRREVEAAEVRAGQLDVQLRVFGPAAGRPTT
jgi:Plasmid replication region DNA-binding N-term